MTVSLHNQPIPWNRTLPRPAALLPQHALRPYSGAGSSLSRHRISQTHDLSGRTDDEVGRRQTAPCIVLTHDQAPTTSARASFGRDGNAEDGGPFQETESSRKRNASVMSADDGSRSSSPSSASNVEGQVCICQKEPKIPRPRNAFILYRQHQHAGVVAQHPGLPNPEISKIIGEQWRQLSDKKKEEWKALAEEEKVRHSQQYPEYRYKPKRNGRYSGQASISGPSPTSVDTPTTCEKCGRKTMTTPATTVVQYPSTVSGTSNNSNMPAMAGLQEATAPSHVFASAAQQIQRISAAQPNMSPPHSARVRPYAEVFNPSNPVPLRHDPRIQYTQMSHRSAQGESPDTKRRRFNGNSVYVPGRSVYHEYYYPQHEILSRRSVTQPPAPLQIQANRLPHPQQRRDPSLTLPPLQTAGSHPRRASQSAQSQTQKSEVESMIMSIPVLNKIKILSQVSPNLPAYGLAASPPPIRGAILAVEGMDVGSVFNMTTSLAEQLERDGKFAVRIFGGPDPYALVEASNRTGARTSEGDNLTVPAFLNLINEWHKISEEMVDYVTNKPRLSEQVEHEFRSQENMVLRQDNREGSAEPSGQDSGQKPDESSQPRSPVSAVSPKTIAQTADLSLQSPPPNGLRQQQRHHDMLSRSGSRIPAAALAQRPFEGKAITEGQVNRDAGQDQDAQYQAQSKQSDSTDRPNTQRTRSTDHAGLNPSLHVAKDSAKDAYQNDSGRPGLFGSTAPIPIAIVPHYQLTTVNAASISMPIRDAYSPHSHWQWLATLWRGCVGPDVTVVIKTPGEDGDTSVGEAHAPSTLANANLGAHLQAQGHNQQAQAQNAAGVIGPMHPQVHPSHHYHNQSTSQLRTHHLFPSSSSSSATATSAPTSSTSASTVPTATNNNQGPGVEIRLSDCRAVIVRTGFRENSTGSSNNNNIGNRKDGGGDSSLSCSLSTTDKNATISNNNNSEAWEKAKRRVGFEVEEFLRR